MVFGALFLLAFAGGFAELLSLKPGLVTVEGVKDRLQRIKLGTWTMAAVAWLTVIIGTWVPYQPYRAKTPDSPKSILLSSPLTRGWHEFGMEWKEHIAWIAPILATVVAYLVYYYGSRLVKEEKARRIAMIMFTVAFMVAAVAGLFGALITKAAPVK
jgi:peptidoglycan/LPS O-acetylase OafA/YrhL